MSAGTLNLRQSVSKELLKFTLALPLPLTVSCFSKIQIAKNKALIHSSSLFDNDLSPCCTSIQPYLNKELACYACYAVSWRLACTPDHSLNSHKTEKSHSEKFSIAKNKCNFGLWELVQMQLGILKTTYYWNNFFEFSRYSGFIFQVRWTKAKTITSDFSRIRCTKNYLNRFIPDWVMQEMIGRRFLP